MWYGLYNDRLLCVSEKKKYIERYFKKFTKVKKTNIEITEDFEYNSSEDIELYEISNMFSKRPITILDELIIDREFNSLMSRVNDFELTVKELGLHRLLDETVDSEFEDALCTVAYKLSILRKTDSKLYKRFKKSYYKNHQIRNISIDKYIKIIDIYLNSKNVQSSTIEQLSKVGIK